MFSFRHFALNNMLWLMSLMHQALCGVDGSYYKWHLMTYIISLTAHFCNEQIMNALDPMCKICECCGVIVEMPLGSSWLWKYKSMTRFCWTKMLCLVEMCRKIKPTEHKGCQNLWYFKTFGYVLINTICYFNGRYCQNGLNHINMFKPEKAQKKKREHCLKFCSVIASLIWLFKQRNLRKLAQDFLLLRYQQRKWLWLTFSRIVFLFKKLPGLRSLQVT